MKTESISDPADLRAAATAFALDELSAEERAAFEQQIDNDSELASLAKETKEFCSLLTHALREPVPSLADSKRAELLAAAMRNRRPAKFWIPWAAGAAACVACGAFLYSHYQSTNAFVVSSPKEADIWSGGGSGPESGTQMANKAEHPASATQLVSTAPPITIRPDMPKPLFAGTPLPESDPLTNLDKSGKPVLEVQVPAGVSLVSKGKPVISSDTAPLGELSLVTDGDKDGDDGYFVDLLPGKQWIQIDLGQRMEIYLIWMWHFHKQAVIYKDVVVQISDDPEFKTATTVFNNDYDNTAGFGAGKELSWVETNNGRPMPVNAVTGRYVRCWSSGRNIDDTNQYIEVEVYGRSPQRPALLADSNGSVYQIPVARISELGRQIAYANDGQTIVTTGITELNEVPQIADRTASSGLASTGTNGLLVLPASTASASTAPAAAGETTVRPPMPKPLFAGTPLPLSSLDSSGSVSQMSAEQRIASWAGRGRGTGRGTGIGAGSGDGHGPGGAPARAPVATTEGLNQFHAGIGGIYLTNPPEKSKTGDDLYLSATPGQTYTSGTESYKPLPENPFRGVLREPLSTFSIDVDTASYSNVRRFLNMGQCPPPEAVRLEELVNYFPYDYAQPVDGKPFAVHVEMTSAPWNQHHRLARIALKGKEIPQTERPAANLVFLVDVSGSMQPENKLPLVKQSLKFVVERLTEKDTVSMVTYAGESGVALPATNGGDKARILAAINGLHSGGSTNGAGGINTAYAQAAMQFNKEGINRVILATDGDFNVGVTSHEELQTLVTEKAKSGVFLSVLGYGMGNTKDDTMELLADKGNGNYAYIDSLSEARKSLADQFSGTLVTIAKDVKIQIEFNPAIIREYRLLGYENRMLAKEDFNNDKKDAGEIGAGHTVTALYELIPVGAPEVAVTTIDKLKYQPQPEPAPAAPAAAPPANMSGETMTVKLRWKAPDADVSQLVEVPVKDPGAKIAGASSETRWAVAVAGFAALLNNSQFAGLSWEDVRALARSSKGADPNGYRGEFLQLINKAESVRR